MMRRPRSFGCSAKIAQEPNQSSVDLSRALMHRVIERNVEINQMADYTLPRGGSIDCKQQTILVTILVTTQLGHHSHHLGPPVIEQLVHLCTCNRAMVPHICN